MAGKPPILEQLDQDYVEKTSKLPMGDAAAIRNSDYLAMRKWLKEVYVIFPSKPGIKGKRPPASIEIENIPISYAGKNSFSVRVYNPAIEKDVSKPRSALLMFHGGGWIHGLPEMDEGLAKFLASDLRAVVIGVDYRLAPEYPFPAPRDDGYEALNWTITNASKYSIDPRRIGLWGISAGGNLAASVALLDCVHHKPSRIRHLNLVVPAVCHPDLVSPEIHHENGSMRRFAMGGKDGVSNSALKRLWEMYAGTKFSDPYASVLLATPPPNHPSVHMTAAGMDPFRDEGIAYAIHLRNAGIDSQLEVVPGVPHSITLSPNSFAAAQFYRSQSRVLNMALNLEPLLDEE